jgi:hypothetical protein
MIDYSHILSSNYAGKEWTLVGNDYDGLEWRDGSPKPTKEELDSQWESVSAIKTAEEASRNRQQAYIAEADPLFFKAQRGEATMEEWQAKVADIKNRWPK